eukprot:1040166-Pyramimonas_sp.AAC.1
MHNPCCSRQTRVPKVADMRGAEVRGGCPVRLGAVDAAPWARQVRGDWHACAGCPAKLTTAWHASGPRVLHAGPVATLWRPVSAKNCRAL